MNDTDIMIGLDNATGLTVVGNVTANLSEAVMPGCGQDRRGNGTAGGACAAEKGLEGAKEMAEEFVWVSPTESWFNQLAVLTAWQDFEAHVEALCCHWLNGKSYESERKIEKMKMN